MAFQSGTVTGFSGATGLLQALLDFIVGTEITAESLNGTGTSWSGSLAHTPVGLGRLIIHYTISGVAYTATDDGSGTITGDHITAGSITYSTGAYSITFDTTPDATPTADYIYGAEGQDWRLELKRNTRDNQTAWSEPFGSDCKEVILSNKGLSGQENVIVGIRECKYPAADYYAWNMNLYFYYNDGMSWNASSEDHGATAYDETYEAYIQHPSMPMIDGTMYYWFYSNQQRIIVVVKVQSNYESAYLGFGRRFGNPSDYPFPYYLAGSSYGTANYTATGGGRAFIINPTFSYGGYAAWWVKPDNSVIRNTTTANGPLLVPMWYFSDPGVSVAPTKNGKVLLTPNYVLASPIVSDFNHMDLDGVLHAMANTIQSEDLVNFDSKRYRIFQNVYRSDYYQFMAVEEGPAVSTTTTTTSTSTSTTTTTI